MKMDVAKRAEWFVRPAGGIRVSPEAGFTMAEIAIALGVIAFALIAIIGILPSGLQVQRDNREETIINQDARLLLQAVRSGGRDVSDLSNFVVSVDGGAFTGNSLDVVRLLSDRDNQHVLVFSAISGGIASRGTELGFRYQVITSVSNFVGGADEFGDRSWAWGLPLSNQVHEVRLRFSWPVRANGQLASEANRYVARAVIAGWHTNGVFYAQEFHQPLR